MRLIARVLAFWTLYPVAVVLLRTRSALQALRSIGKRPKVWFEADHDGRKIMLLALYQKGEVRPDILRLLDAAREAGLYVLAVNTLRLTRPETLEGRVHCYIERFNFGRDFGSYKTGFLHVFARGWQRHCPRLMMLNDSVFFSEARLARFLDEMMGSEVEVLGSTENHEYEYHLGSFCIAIGQRVLAQPRLEAYWRGYRLSDIRPRVIQTGEKRLSRTLKACASSPGEFRALHGAASFNERVLGDDAFLDFALRNARVCEIIRWRRVSMHRLVASFGKRYLADASDLQAGDTGDPESPGRRRLSEAAYINSFAELEAYLRRHLVPESRLERDALRKLVASHLTEVFMDGSQIHQNPATMLEMGLPIVKLDGLYRGVFSVQDVHTIAAQLNPQEAAELRALLLARPFGGDVLVGWKRIAFYRGLL